MNDRFVNAYDKATGLKHRIPRHWLDHPTLSKPWRLTPKQRAADGTNTDPTAGSATPGTDVVTTTPPENPTTSTTETPAAGAKE